MCTIYFICSRLLLVRFITNYSYYQRGTPKLSPFHHSALCRLRWHFCSYRLVFLPFSCCDSMRINTRKVELVELLQVSNLTGSLHYHFPGTIPFGFPWDFETPNLSIRFFLYELNKSRPLNWTFLLQIVPYSVWKGFFFVTFSFCYGLYKFSTPVSTGMLDRWMYRLMELLIKPDARSVLQ